MHLQKVNLTLKLKKYFEKYAILRNSKMLKRDVA